MVVDWYSLVVGVFVGSVFTAGILAICSMCTEDKDDEPL